MLRVTVTRSDVQSGSVPVSWCVTKDILDAIKAAGATDPHILFCIVNPRGRETRKLVPLTDLMTFLEFTAPGENTVLAAIVWTANSRYSVQSLYLDRDFHEWKKTVADRKNRHEFWSDFNVTEDIPLDELTCKVAVEMPQECFAKEPSAWEKKWVNLMWRDKAVDQCDFRTRRMWAYSGQLLIGIPVYAFRILAAVFLTSILSKGIDYRPLYAPLDNKTEWMWSNLDGTWIPKPEFFWPFHTFVPLVFLAVMGIGAFTLHESGDGATILGAALFALKWCAILAGCGYVLFAAFGLVILIVTRWTGIKRAAYRVGIKSRMRKEDELLPYLLCDGGTPFRSVNELPKKFRTFRLRFQDLKARVCRPFAN